MQMSKFDNVIVSQLSILSFFFYIDLQNSTV